MENVFKLSADRDFTESEKKYVKRMAALLAAESALPAEWIEDLLKRTFPPDLSFKSNDPDKLSVEFLYHFKPCLFEAMKWLPADEIEELFSEDLNQLLIMEENYESLISEIPLHDFEKLWPKFRKYLADETQNIIETGYPKNLFPESYWLQEAFTESFVPRDERRSLRGNLEADLTEAWAEGGRISARLEQFNDGCLSKDFLVKHLPLSYGMPQRELLEKPWMIGADRSLFDLRDRLKQTLTPVVAKLYPLKELNNYLKQQQITVPTDLESKDKELHSILHSFAQDAFQVFVLTHRGLDEHKTLHKVWDLVAALDYKVLDLVINGKLSYFGVDVPSSEVNLYRWGKLLMERVLNAASVTAEQARSEFLKYIREALEPMLSDFRDEETGYTDIVDYSIYQAIYLCSLDSVKTACGKFGKAKEEMARLRSGVKKDACGALENAFDKLRVSRLDFYKQTYLRLAAEEGVIASELKSQPERKIGFSPNYTEYHPNNRKFEVIKFVSPDRREVARLLHAAYRRGEHQVPLPELLRLIFGEDQSEAIMKEHGPNGWRLESQLFRSEDLA
ncbi:MAG: hypothetical protein KDD60_09780, partial [Bdellovibrionales bacterium]|nr:hypothetical protein [Bdellovibrionales bacterium]